MIKIVAKAKVKPEYRAKFMELAKILVSASQAEQGNVYYNLHESTEDPSVMAFIEGWQDEASIEIHNNTPHFTNICPQFAEFFDGEMEVTHYTVVV